ncbi:MAG: hypothetical protein NVSMB12_15730 [Acidimicrobiales bacterium]
MLSRAAWPAVAARAGASLLAVPIGSTEQHGPHLPLGTDTCVARVLAERLAATRDDVIVAPALPYGASGEHAGFAGTLSIGTAVLRDVLVEIVRSADAFAGVVLISGHGGNAAALRDAVTIGRSERRRVMAWEPRREVFVDTGRPPDAHAGRTETSLLLAVAPHQVHLDRAEPGNLRALGELVGELRAGGVASVSPNGVLGDPAGATATEGAALLDALGADLAAAVAAW